MAFPRLSLLCSKSLLFGRPGFDSRRAPTLGTHSFGAHEPKFTYNTSFDEFLAISIKDLESQGRGNTFRALYTLMNYRYFTSCNGNCMKSNMTIFIHLELFGIQRSFKIKFSFLDQSIKLTLEECKFFSYTFRIFIA